jgi:Lrp/AsnC family leucine-responsive transcriptional regulator
VDQLDREILGGLQREGRKTNVALSRQLDLSTVATLSRVKRLVESGAIRGYRAIVDPTALGIAVQAFTLVKLREHSEHAIREFEQAVKDVVGVRSCYHVAGRFDMIMMLAVCDLDHLAQIIRVDLARIPGLMQLETMLILAESVADEGWPVFPGEMRSADGRRSRRGVVHAATRGALDATPSVEES